MNAIAGFLSVLPDQMRDPVLFAIPFFLLLLILEWTAARKLERIEREAAIDAERSAPSGFGRVPDRRFLGEHPDGAGVGGHHRGLEVHRPARLCRDLRVSGSMALTRDALVHVGDRDPRRGSAVLLLSPHRRIGFG